MNKSELISKGFEIIQHCTCNQFVTLRGFDEIPNQISVNNYIDVMVCGSHVIPYINEEFKKGGFIMHVDDHSYMYGAEPHYQFVNTTHDVKFDIVTGLYYRSSNDKMLWIPINKEVQKSMIVNKVKVDEIWIQFLLTVIDEEKVKLLMERALYASWEKVYDTMKTNPVEIYNAYVSYTKY